MKKLILPFLMLFAMSASAQDLNKKIQDPGRNKEVMLNVCTREGVVSFPEMKAMYDQEYPNYKLDSAALVAMKPSLKDKKITIVMGTWCGDSKYQVPHFYKILDSLNVSEDQVKLICVDGTKKAENGLLDGLDIQRVPTFIFYDDKKEIGRITERPKETLEKDMANILASKAN